jgi:hypothetical protein
VERSYVGGVEDENGKEGGQDFTFLSRNRLNIDNSFHSRNDRRNGNTR